jgi:hypothetical protein
MDYQINGEIPIIQQPTSMSCWATCATMMMSWQNQQSFSIETVMNMLESDFRSIYDEDTGLSVDRNQDFATATGLQIEYPTCDLPEAIESRLESFGPLLIIDDEDSSANFALHARIITGISGDGTPENTLLNIIDPGNGRQYQETFETFTNKYEQAAGVEDLTIQMMHY